MPSVKMVCLADVDPELPLSEVERAYRRGYVHGAFAATDHRRVRASRVAAWLDRLGLWRREADLARREERIPRVAPPTLSLKGAQ
jgi:hypothetical protein